MTVLTETKHQGAYIVSEASGYLSRDQIPFQPNASARSISGTVIGRKGDITKMTATVAAAAGNVGNGVVTLDGAAPLTAAAKEGVYEVIARAAGATAAFEVIDPDGVVVGEGAIGSTFSGPVKFVWAAGGTAAAIGDRQLITVVRSAAGDLWGALDFTQTTGWQNAAGVLFTQVEAGNSVVQAVGTTRMSEVRASDLTWPAGATAAQIALATDQLRSVGIVLR